ncbi:MAG: serine hydrolase [Chthoniobacterales bacterium]
MKPFLLALLLTAALLSRAAADYREYLQLPPSETLQHALAQTAEATAKQFSQITADNLALSAIDLTNSAAPVRADYHGDAPFYPASVMKLFVMTHLFQMDRHSPEIERALRAMIQVSDNDATAYLIDVLSGTTAGPELEGKELADFIERRGATNRYFASLGYDISVSMKPWSFGPYGREMQLLGENRERRNRASANSIAALLYWIVQKKAVSGAASEAMLPLLERPLAPPRPDENQVKEFLGESFPPGTRLWSKSGETSEVRHDAAYIELPDGRKLIIVALTRAGEEKALLPAIGRNLLGALDDGRASAATSSPWARRRWFPAPRAAVASGAGR